MVRKRDVILLSIVTLAAGFAIGFNTGYSRGQRHVLETIVRLDAKKPGRDTPGPRRRMTQAEFGKDWPFTVAEVDIECRTSGDYHIPLVHSAGMTYGLNGTAVNAGFPEFRPIWRDNPTKASPKIDIGPMIDAALKVCEQ